MTDYRMVIFDFDGTLADSAPWFMRTLNEVAKDHGFRQVSDDELEMLRGKPNREIIRYLGVRFWQMPGIARDMRRRSAEAADGIPLFDGIPELLGALKRSGIRVALVSSNGEDTCRRVLGPVAREINHFSCGVSIFGKAARFRSLLKICGMTARETLSVGDEGRDVEAARKVGMASAAVTWGYATEDALRACNPTLVVRSPLELAQHLGISI